MRRFKRFIHINSKMRYTGNFIALSALLILMFSCNRRESENEIEQNIYRSGDSMMAAFKRRDFKTFVKYNHPNMTKMMGGPEAFAAFIEQQMKQLPDTAIKNIEFGKILKVVKTPKDYQCLVEQNLKMEVEGVTLDRTTYLIGESLDKGKTWTFLDASTKSVINPKNIKPDISPELKIPAIKQ